MYYTLMSYLLVVVVVVVASFSCGESLSMCGGTGTRLCVDIYFL